MADIVSNLEANYGCQDNAASTVVVANPGTNGTLTGAGNTSASSVAGPGGLYPLALDLASSSDTIDANSNCSLNNAANATITCWVYRSATGTIQMFGTRASSAQRFLVQWHSDNSIYFSVGAVFPSFASMLTGYHHLAGVFEGGGSPKQRLYLDGALVALTGTLTTASTLPATQGNVIVNRDIASVYGAGRYADLRVYTRALAAEDIAAIYALGLSFKPQTVIF